MIIKMPKQGSALASVGGTHEHNPSVRTARNL